MKDPELYVEEFRVDGCLYKHQSLFNPNSSYVVSIAGRHVIAYDVKSGKRKLILSNDVPFCGIKWQDEETLLAVSVDASVSKWNMKEGTSISQSSLNFKGRLIWTYNVEEFVFVIAALPNKEEQVVLRLDLDEKSVEQCVKLPVESKTRRSVFPTDQFVLYCNGRDLNILPYDGVEMKGKLRFRFNSVYAGLPRDAIAFTSVTMVNNTVFAVLSVGRIICWYGVTENGLQHTNKSFIHSHYTEPYIAVTPLLAIFCGTANSRIEKWNIVTSGSGRYERFQVMERADAPIEALWLSQDSNFLLAIMSDNSMLILNTVSLAVVSRPISLHWPAFYKPLDWLGLYTDIEHPDYLVTNTRTGYIQWIDPTKWRTIGEFDVSKENPPPRDCISMPNHNWSNVYAVSCTSSMIVTAESRRMDCNKTVLKFFCRMTPGAMYDIKHLGSIKLQNRVRFIRSNMEEVRHDLSERIVREHYVVVIDYDGNIQTFFPNPYESYRWVVDLRRTFDWQQTKVIDCSTIRSNTLATVNAVKGTPDKSLGILIWNTKTATLTDFIDNIPDIIQVRWSPPHKFRESLLLVSSKKLITAYDVDAKNFVWIIMEPNVRLYTNSFCIIAYGEKSAYSLNYRDGSVIKRMEFTRKQSQIVATGNNSNIRLSGLNSRGLSLLKPDTKENLTLRDIELFTKSTPFSVLIQQARMDNQPANTNQLHRIKTLSARKLLEGSAYSLAPITQLAPAFVGSCLISKSTV